MKVRAKKNVIFNGKIYNTGAILDIEPAIFNEKLFEKLQDVAEPEIEEGEPAEGLPPLKKK